MCFWYFRRTYVSHSESGSWLGAFLNARAGTIYAGTSEVQRNVIAQRVLGLPRGT